VLLIRIFLFYVTMLLWYTMRKRGPRKNAVLLGKRRGSVADELSRLRGSEKAEEASTKKEGRYGTRAKERGGG
jgi:hypothetical protein